MTKCFLLLFFVLTFQASAQKKETPNVHPFWLVILKTGTAQIMDSTQKAKLFEGHFANMKKLHEEGILKIAGPFGKNDKEYRGLFILDCASMEEATKYVNTDPTIQSGIFTAEITQWFAEPSGSLAHGKPKKKKKK